MCLFGLFINSGFPLVLLAGPGLLLTAAAIHRCLRKEHLALHTFGLVPVRRKVVWYMVGACVIGGCFAVAYRWVCGWELLPAALGAFVVVAAAIGAAEEIVYRGYIQGRMQAAGTAAAVVLGSLCHTGYKLTLCVFPPAGVEVDYGFVVVWTFVGGIVLGALRAGSKSVFPAMIAHVCFDILVYGGLSQSPWWVWS